MCKSVRRPVVFLSNHVYNSDRRAGFHWLADSFSEAGWKVTFVTTGLSRLSSLSRDTRTVAPSTCHANRVKDSAHPVHSVCHRPLFHPVDLGSNWLNRLTTPVFSLYGRRLSKTMLRLISEADVVVFESSAALLFVDAVKNANPAAQLVYRVSDDVR